MATTILPENLEKTELVEQDDLLVGPLLTPANTAKHLGKGSIHDDATAKKLGFRGGTVAGSLHMEQFPPLGLRIFGERWWQTGGLSLYFRYATADLEPVRCFAKTDGDMTQADVARVNTWMEDDQDHLIAEGTLNIGGADLDSPLRKRIAETPAPKDIRILESLEVGAISEAVPTRVEKAAVEGRLKVITEPLAVYEKSPAYLPPSLMVQIMRPSERELLARNENTGVGLFGAIEVQHLKGPVLAETDYTVTTEVLAISETPKTEYFWYESKLYDSEGDATAHMLMMLRFMKASSSLWDE